MPVTIDEMLIASGAIALGFLAAVAFYESLSAEERATITAPRPPARDARRARDRVLRYAWAAVHLGPESPQALRAAGALAGSRSVT